MQAPQDTMLQRSIPSEASGQDERPRAGAYKAAERRGHHVWSNARMPFATHLQFFIGNGLVAKGQICDIESPIALQHSRHDFDARNDAPTNPHTISAILLCPSAVR